MCIAQPWPQQAYLVHPLNKLENLGEILELGSQDCNRGNVTVEEDCLSLSSSFSFNKFISHAFPDIAKDLDSFI